MALARLHRDSQPASQPRRLGRHSPGRTRDRARRPPRGRPAWSPRAPLPGDTSTRLSRRETRPPARPAPATPPPCPAADEYTLSRYTRTKHHCHNTTRRHRPISRSCLLPSCHTAATAPPPRRAHYFRVTTDRARRAPPPPTPAAAPAHAVDRAHPRTRFAPRTATVLPALAANGNPAGDPLTAADRNSIHCRVQQAVCAAAAGPLRRRASGSSWASLPAAACPTQMPFAGARRARPS